MSVVPADLETTRGPPMIVPLRHFVVGLGFLLLGVAVGLGTVFGIVPGRATLAHVHLLLAGWICITIMGAMTQFVPVWSNVRLYSERLATVQLWLVVVGLLGFAGSLVLGRFVWLATFGATMALGFWVFVYNVGRTLWPLPSYDVTEYHFALALGFFAVVTVLGLLLAVDLVTPVFASLPVARTRVVRTHATVAVFGAIVTTIVGALYQLATMFTGTDLHGIDRPLRRLETVGYPTGVLLLASGRLIGSVPLARLGGTLVLVSLAGFGTILGRRLYETRVEWTPMLARYAVVVAALALWIALALPTWIREPLARGTTFGAPGTVHLLVLGIVGFVVLGTLYHVVPFIVWVHRYGDLLGLEPVPTIDDLYSDRVATADFAFLTVGSAVLVAGDLAALPSVVSAAGGVSVLTGTVLFLANVLSVVRTHSPHSLLGILFATFATEADPTAADGTRRVDGR